MKMMADGNPFFTSILVILFILPFNLGFGIYAYFYLSRFIRHMQSRHSSIFSQWLHAPLEGTWDFFQSQKLKWGKVYHFAYLKKIENDDDLYVIQKRFRITSALYVATFLLIVFLLFFGSLIF